MSLKQFYIENATKETLLMEIEHLEAVVSELRAQLSSAVRELDKLKPELRKAQNENERLSRMVERLQHKNNIHVSTISNLRSRLGIKTANKGKEVLSLLLDGKTKEEIRALGYDRRRIFEAMKLISETNNEPTNN